MSLMIELSSPTAEAVFARLKPIEQIENPEVGCAYLYDTSESQWAHPTLIVDPRIKCVIICIYPGPVYIGEGLESWSLGSFRWLQYEDSLTPSPTPDDEDIVIMCSNAASKWSVGRYAKGTPGVFRSWQTASMAARLMRTKTPHSKIWYWDSPAGNFHLWDL